MVMDALLFMPAPTLPCAGNPQFRYCPAFPDPIVQWPRTPPFHGGNTGSNPVRVALFRERDAAATPRRLPGGGQTATQNRLLFLWTSRARFHILPGCSFE